MKLSVLMSTYHKEKPEYFERCMQSIWGDQLLKPNEIVLVLNGPLTDELYEVIRRWKSKIGRIFKTIPLEKNIGLSNALNTGIESCSGDFIARMDTDDVSLPNRFKVQVDYLIKNPDVSVLGAWISKIDKDGNIVGKDIECPLTNIDIKFTLTCMTSFAHPTVIMKKEIFENFEYSLDYPYAQDYKLWTDIALSDFKMGNLEAVLLKHRIHQNQESNVGNQMQYFETLKIASEYREKLIKKNVINYDIKYENTTFSYMRKMLFELKMDIYRHKASKKVRIKLAQYILKHNKQISLRLYAAYFLEIRQDIKLNLSEVKLFLQAILHVSNRNSFFVKLIKKFV